VLGTRPEKIAHPIGIEITVEQSESVSRLWVPLPGYIIPRTGGTGNRQRDPAGEREPAGRSLPGPLMLVTFPVDKLPARSLYALQPVYWIGSTVEPSLFRYDAAWAVDAASEARRNSVKMRISHTRLPLRTSTKETENTGPSLDAWRFRFDGYVIGFFMVNDSFGKHTIRRHGKPYRWPLF